MNPNTPRPCARPVTVNSPNTSAPLPTGDDQTTATLAAMAIIAGDAGRKSPLIRGIAEGLVLQALGELRQPKTVPDAGKVARALFDFTRTRWAFQADPAGIESVTHPDTFAAVITAGGTARGDCDDRATFTAAVLRALNLPALLVVVSRSPRGRFEHVAAALGSSDDPFYLDSQEAPAIGQLPAGVKRVRHFKVP